MDTRGQPTNVLSCFPRYPNPDGDTFKGTPGATIPNGIESNVSAGALALRAGLDHPDGLQGLPDSHPVWEFAVHYLAGACVNLALVSVF